MVTQEKTKTQTAAPHTQPFPLKALFFFMLMPLWGYLLEKYTTPNLFVEEDALYFLTATCILVMLSPWIVPGFLTEWITKLTGYFRGRKLPACLAAAIGLLSLFGGIIAINREVLHSFMNSADEHSCLFLAECLRMGKLFVEPHELSDFFNVVHVGNRDGKWFSVYPLGWPLIMSLALEWNVLDYTNPALVSVSLIFYYLAGKRLFGAQPAALGLTLVAFTCFFTFTAASYASHGLCILLIGIFLYTYLKWMDSKTEKQRMIWGCLTAVAIGYGLMTRYLTMAVMAFPFLLHHYWPLLRRKQKWHTSDKVVVGILAAFVLSILWHNWMVTGKPTRAPNKHDKSWEKLGFRDNYTPLDGIRHITARFFYLLDWMPPFLVAVYFVGLTQIRKQDAYQKITAYAFLLPVAAYFFYFSWGGNQYGPRYYYDGLPIMGLVIGKTLHQAWCSGKNAGKKAVVAVLILSAAASVYQFQKHGEYFEAVSRQRKALYTAAEERVRKPALVFIKGFLGQRLVMSQEDAVRNHPALNTPILYAHDRGELNAMLRGHFPHRIFYRGSYDREKLEPVIEELPV